jgi:hypothetical protein
MNEHSAGAREFLASRTKVVKEGAITITNLARKGDPCHVAEDSAVRELVDTVLLVGGRHKSHHHRGAFFNRCRTPHPASHINGPASEDAD